MFKVDIEKNRIYPVPKKKFCDLGFRERLNLQEWLVHQSDALGEDILIIQKEFDGFDDTRERLDLLAIDKKGNLVVIENKLDDSGKDLVWQALKYTAYISGLTKSQILDIYQQYLNRYESGSSAIDKICEFLDVDDIDEAILNAGTGQRIMFIAANFRKEVTATVLWLIGRGIRLQCFKVTPYAFNNDAFIDIDQIIPPPEAADYMIGITSKEIEEVNVQGVQSERHKIRFDFWSLLLSSFKERNITLFSNISPSKDHWLNAGSGLNSCPYSLIFGKREVRVEISLNRSSQQQNKWLFDKLYEDKDEIENIIGQNLDWKKMEDKRSSRIVLSHPFDGYNKDEWQNIIEWLASTLLTFQRAFQPHLDELARLIRVTPFFDNIENDEEP